MLKIVFVGVRMAAVESLGKLEPAALAPLRAAAWDVCTTREFEAGVLACVGLNALVMSAQHFGQPDWLTRLSSQKEEL